MDSCELVCVDPARIDQAWPLVAHLIKGAMDRGRISDYATVEHDVLNGGALVWIAWDSAEIRAAAVSQIARVMGDKYCTIIACGGKGREEWLPLIRGIEVYAEQEGCKAIRIFGRTGWARALPSYKTTRVLLEKELSDGR